MRHPWAFQRWAFEQQTGNPTRKAVLSMLAMMADAETGRCEAKQATLAQGVEASERIVRGHLKALEDAGIIGRRAQFRVDRGRRSDEYLLLAPWVTEWPDGEAIDVQPADLAGGGNDADLAGGGNDAQQPGGPVTSSRTPRSPAAGQELPPRNDHSRNGASSASARTDEWLNVPDEMLEAAVRLQREKVKVNGRVVTGDEMRIAAAALAEFNRQAESAFSLGAKPHFPQMVMRIREHPTWDAAKHVRLVQSAFRVRWWERRGGRGRAQPRVIYSDNSFENVVQDAADEAKGTLVAPVLRLKDRLHDGMAWDELPRYVQDNLKENELMRLGYEDSAALPAAPALRNGNNGSNGQVVTADNICD